MNQNSLAIQVICSHLSLGEDAVPYEPKEWSELASVLYANSLEPKDLLLMDYLSLKEKLQYDEIKMQRLQRLLDRGPAISFEISDYENMGVHFATRADKEYPVRIKRILGQSCPPIFCYSGDLSILNNDAMGFVGSRSVDETDMNFTKALAGRAVEMGYTIVSGGAKGIDSIAINVALEMERQSIVILADSLIGKLKVKDIRIAVQEGRLLLMSAVKPNAPWNVGNAMGRNKYIYAQSKGTVVVKSDYNTGGTWSGATECLRHGWTPVYCWNNLEYKGNQALIEKGAIAVDALWDCNVRLKDINTREECMVNEDIQQISFFD